MKEAGSTSAFLVSPETEQLLRELDGFIENKIKPLQAADDNEKVRLPRRPRSSY